MATGFAMELTRMKRLSIADEASRKLVAWVKHIRDRFI